MSKPENALWESLKAATGHQILWQRHEDRHSPDIPDLSFVTTAGCGWVELKVSDKWPVKSSTPINIPHLTPGQVNWAIQRWVMGANCWMLLKISETGQLVLTNPYVMHHILHRKYTQEMLLGAARKVWDSMPDPLRMIQAINFRTDAESAEFIDKWQKIID